MTWTPSPEPTATPPPTARPTDKPTAEPKPAEESVSLDRFKVYYSDFLTGSSWDVLINYSIWYMRGDGKGASKLFSEAQQPALSDDGSKLAYVHLNSGIFVYDLATGENKHVINSESAVSPSFSPGAYRISYAEYVVARWWQIFTAQSVVRIAHVDGSNDGEAVAGRRPAWSPTSGLIAYEACQGTTCGILILNSDNGHTRLLVGESAGKASWSPDGQTITYSMDGDGDSEIWRINVDGSNKTKLTDNNSTDALAAWSPDGRYIYFLSDRKDGWGIWVMNSDGTGQRKIKSIGVPRYWQWATMAVGWNR